MKRIGIYGGSFSPPHVGHMTAAVGFARQMRLDELLLIPAYEPPHKELSRGANAEQRIEMCRIAVEACDALTALVSVTVSDMEIKRGGTSYTVLTLRELAGKDKQLFFLCGTDMAVSLDTWKCPEELFSLATFVCYHREDTDEARGLLIEKNRRYKEKYGNEVQILQGEICEISSGELRQRIQSGESCEGFLSAGVEAYIRKWDLYRK